MWRWCFALGSKSEHVLMLIAIVSATIYYGWPRSYPENSWNFQPENV